MLSKSIDGHFSPFKTGVKKNDFGHFRKKYEHPVQIIFKKIWKTERAAKTSLRLPQQFLEHPKT